LSGRAVGGAEHGIVKVSTSVPVASVIVQIWPGAALAVVPLTLNLREHWLSSTTI